MPGAEPEVMRRCDTDADWRELGRSNPYWAVLTNPDGHHGLIILGRKTAPATLDS